MKKLILGLLTLTALGVVSLPASADDATVQDSRQTVYQNGVDNSAGQSSVQKNRASQEGRRDGNTGQVQTSDQLTDQYGIGNTSDQRVRQENVRKDRGHRSCGVGCEY
jgi:hypothetical protein